MVVFLTSPQYTALGTWKRTLPYAVTRLIDCAPVAFEAYPAVLHPPGT